jgi:hypothetical protein
LALRKKLCEFGVFPDFALFANVFYIFYPCRKILETEKSLRFEN